MELIKRISGYTLISVITGGISFLLLPILTSYLTPEDYGVLSIFNACIRFLTALIPLGMGNLLLVYLIEKKDEYPIYLKAFIKITLTLCIVLTLIIGLAHLFINDFFGLPVLLAISMPFIALMVVYFETITSYFIYLKQFKQYAKHTLAKFFIEIALVITLVIIFPFNWEGRVTAVIISLFLIVLYGIYYFTKNKILQLNLTTKNYSKKLIQKGFPLIFMGIAIMVMNLSDRFFIEHFIGLKETGYYSIASIIAGILFMIISASMNVLRPIIYLKLKSGNTKKYIFILTIKFIVSLFIITILLYFATPFLFDYMISEKFSSAQKITPPLIFSLFFWGVYSYFTSFFLYINYTKVIGFLSTIGIITNLFLNYFLVKHYGTIGAAYSTLITYFVMSIGLYILYLVYFKIKSSDIV